MSIAEPKYHDPWTEVRTFKSCASSVLVDTIREKKTALKYRGRYPYLFGGEAAENDEAIGNLLSTVGILGILMVATLVLSFGSFRMAAIIRVVGFLSIGLALISLVIGGYPFGFIVIIGTMGLLGVAINDSIVVLAGIRGSKAACSGDIEATVGEAMHATRHVISTTITTIAGFSPLIFSGGDFWPPLAVAISGGVVGWSLLAVVMVPSLHRWISANQNERKSVLGQFAARRTWWVVGKSIPASN